MVEPTSPAQDIAPVKISPTLEMMVLIVVVASVRKPPFKENQIENLTKKSV